MLNEVEERTLDPNPAEPSPLALHDVCAGYGRIEVLQGVELAVPPSGIAALLGPNGAGKTTALSVMSGLLQPTAGCRHVHGRHVNGADAEDLARIGVRHVREGRSVFPNLTVADNLAVAAGKRSEVAQVQDVAYAMFPRLGERRTQLAGTMSGGERQMLALARGLGAEPSVLLVDELSMGLAPLVVAELYEALAAVAASGVSVLVVEQFAEIGLRYAHQVYVLARGVIVYAGDAAGAGDAIDASYLGGGA